MEDSGVSPGVFQPYKLGAYTLKNRFVMAPLTRKRCEIDTGVPNDLHVQYYSERAESAGLVISECTYVNERGGNFPGGPGIVSEVHIEGWKRVTTAVHERGGLILNQIWHCGRAGFPEVLRGQQALAPSAIAIQQMIDTKEGKKPHDTPLEITELEIQEVIRDFGKAAQNAMTAGFDGVEVHGANGYLVDQFLRSSSNKREDGWGGSIENRCKFVLAVVDECIKVWGSDRVGIRLSPAGRYQDMWDSDAIGLYSYLLEKLSEKGIAYVHLPDQDAWRPPVDTAEHIPPVIENVAKTFRPYLKTTLITGAGLTLEEAERRVKDGEADLVCFGRLFISNPDLVERFKNGWPLTPFDNKTFYTPGPVGYIDYPKYKIPTRQDDS